MFELMTKAHFTEFWPVFKEVVSAQETYAFDPNIRFDQAYAIWCELPLRTYAVVNNGRVLASYYLKANAAGPGDHICNCGYMVSSKARGQGLARRMCDHSQREAVLNGFTAMQFNSVVSTNDVAVALWHKLGFQTIGTIPNGYRHRTLGNVDSYIMYKSLTNVFDFIPAASDQGNALADIRALAMRPSLESIGRFDADRVRQRFLDSFAPEDTICILFEQQTVGFYVLRKKADHLYLDHLYIHPDHQKSGIGGQVLEKIKKIAVQSSLPMRLGALKGSPANHFYKRHGFVETHQGEFDVYYEYLSLSDQ